jgi:4-hydroxybenzoate polyprenyltransferase
MTALAATTASRPVVAGSYTPLRRTRPLAPARPRAAARVCWWVWLEARPIVQVVFLLRFIAGGMVSAGGTLLTAREIVGALSWTCATAAVYVLNGAADLVEDRRNGSRRPIASGRLSQQAAISAVVLLAAAAMLLSELLPGRATLLTALMLVLGWAYSWAPSPLKNSMSGFLVVVVSAGALTYLAGCNAAGGGADPDLILFAAAMSCWIGLGGSTKDLGDVAGDQAAGRRTWPIVLGDTRARILMGALAALLGIGFTLAAAVWLHGLLPSAAAVLAGAAVLSAQLTLTAGGRGTERAVARRPYKAFMLTQYVAHVGVLAGITV